MKARNLTAALFALVLAGGCSGVPLRENPQATPYVIQTGASKSCLAMSGGGLRSGAVSLGAIQGLYAAKALSQFELISAVSGGGYPVYGLLDRMIRDKIALRDLLREHGRYIADVERDPSFITLSDFYSELVFQALFAIPASQLTRAFGSLQPSYITRIHNSFVGVSRPFSRGPVLSRAKDIRKLQGFPEPIFGTSASLGLNQPQDDYPYRFGEYFELSPTINGAPAIGYFPRLSRIMTVGEAVAISAAAIDTPQSDTQLPKWVKALNFGSGSRFLASTDSGQSVRFYLADGGFIENLGLLPLLRRGCTDILLFDNTDEESTPFQSWRTFAARVTTEESGWRVSEQYELRSANGQSLPTRTEDRWNLSHHLWDALLENGNRRVRLRLVKLGIDRAVFDDYPQRVREYARQNWGEAHPRCTDDEGMSRRCSFPLEASARQSFLPEEFRAYRLLGGWLARLALSTPPTIPANHEGVAP